MQIEREAADRARHDAHCQVEVRPVETANLQAFGEIKFQPQSKFGDKTVGRQADNKDQAAEARFGSHHPQRLTRDAGKAPGRISQIKVESRHCRRMARAQKFAKIGNQGGYILIIVVECRVNDAGLIRDLANAERRRSVRHQKRLRSHQQLVPGSGAFGAAQTTGSKIHDLR